MLKEQANRLPAMEIRRKDPTVETVILRVFEIFFMHFTINIFFILYIHRVVLVATFESQSATES